MAKHITEADILRRVDFLLQEARAGMTVRDNTISFAMRVVSDFYSTGKVGGSASAKLNCRRMSRAAWALYRELPTKEWLAATINEHPETLQRIWAELLAKRQAITQGDLVATFKLHTMVTVTKEEDARLRKLKAHPAGERYRLAEIEVLDIPADGWDALTT